MTIFFSRTREKLLIRLANHIWVFAISCPLCIVQCCIGVYRKSSVIHSILKEKWGWNCLPQFSKDLTLRNLTHECLRVVSYGIFPSLLTFMLTPRDRTKKDLGNSVDAEGRRIHKCKIIKVENSNVLGKQTNPQCSLFRVILKSQGE